MTFFIVRICRCSQNRTFHERKAFQAGIPPFSLLLMDNLGSHGCHSRGLTKADMTNIKPALALNLELSAAGEACKRLTLNEKRCRHNCCRSPANFQINDLSLGVFIALAVNFTQNWFRIGCQVLEIATFSREESSVSFLHVRVSENRNEASLLGFLLLSFDFFSPEAETTRQSCEKFVSSSCCRCLTLMLPQKKSLSSLLIIYEKAFANGKFCSVFASRSGLGN